jgi:hypothetical protein
MSVTVRNAERIRTGEPLSRGRSRAGRRWERRVVRLLKWAASHPALTSMSLTVAYLATLAALVAVLAASALNTAVGIGVLVLYAIMVVVFFGVATYVVIPERPRSRRQP